MAISSRSAAVWEIYCDKVSSGWVTVSCLATVSHDPFLCVTHSQGAWLAISSIVSTAVIVGHLQNEYYVYWNHGSQANTAAWRSLSWIPLFVHCWFLSWASLQSFLLTPDQHNKHLLTARVANSLFVGGGILMTITLFVRLGCTRTTSMVPLLTRPCRSHRFSPSSLPSLDTICGRPMSS